MWDIGDGGCRLQCFCYYRFITQAHASFFLKSLKTPTKAQLFKWNLKFGLNCYFPNLSELEAIIQWTHWALANCRIPSKIIWNIQHVHNCANNMLINKASCYDDIVTASFQDNFRVKSHFPQPSFSSTVKDVLKSRITSWFTLGWSDCFLGIAAPNPPPPVNEQRKPHQSTWVVSGGWQTWFTQSQGVWLGISSQPPSIHLSSKGRPFTVLTVTWKCCEKCFNGWEVESETGMTCWPERVTWHCIEPPWHLFWQVR